MDIDRHDTKRHLLGTGVFRFSEGVSSTAAALAAGYRDFGNITAFSVQPKTDIKEHRGSYRGSKRIDKTRNLLTDVMYQLQGDEVSAEKMKLFLFGDLGAKYTQTAKTAVAVDALTSPVKGKWYPLLINGARVRKATIVALTTTPAVVENVDYIIDYETVSIFWLTTPPGTITSIAITAPAILATDPTSFDQITLHTKPLRRGMCELMIFDKDEATGADRLAYHHPDFLGEIWPEGNPNLATDDWATVGWNLRYISGGNAWMPAD
jgi:hypothetical protein